MILRKIIIKIKTKNSSKMKPNLIKPVTNPIILNKKILITLNKNMKLCLINLKNHNKIYLKTIPHKITI